ncbi:MAG TPA: DUF393 domain-containing protein [Gaiellaceae bacterium]|nr:DUF393 domain-containing protein [Gaiellaceae bacterium]
MAVIVNAWNRFWFPAVPLRRLAIVRMFVCGFALIDVAATGYVAKVGDANKLFYDPLPIYKVFQKVIGQNANTPVFLHAVQVILIVSLLLALVGFATRLALIVAAPLYGLWWATYFAYAPAGAHGRLAVVIALLALAIAPSGRAYSLDSLLRRSRRARPGESLPAFVDEKDRLAGWAIRVIAVYLATAYFLAAYAKLRNAGIGWPWGGAFDAALVEKHTAIGSFLFKYPWIDHIMAGSALLWEATALVTLLPMSKWINRRLRDGWVLYGLTFVVISEFVLDINFMGWVCCYVVFYNVEIAADRIKELAHRFGDRFGRVSVLYDGGCTLCVRTASALQGLDWFGRLRLVNAAADGSQPAHFESDDGHSRVRGFRAYRRLARALPALWPALALSYLPGVSWAGERIYGYIADRRARVGACAIPETAAQPASQS